jgi:hypothetical protein
MFRPQKTLKKARKLYNTQALPALLHVPLKQETPRRITAAEVEYTRKTAGYAWTDYKNKYRDGKGI